MIKLDAYIKSMNEHLQHLERPSIKEIYPNLYIIGLPRSGTTILSQVLSYTLDVGYINNLIARFYKAPFIGAILSLSLGIKREISFKSELGRTPLISDPHEFGYFWSELLGYNKTHDMKVDEYDKSKQDFKKLRTEILALNAVFNRPIVFKNVLIGFFADELINILEKSVFIYIEREIFDNIVSIYMSRKKRYGTFNKWWSLKPKEYERLKGLSPEEQVVAQVYYLKRELENHVSHINKHNIIRVSYDHLCNNPMDVVKSIVEFVEENLNFKITIVNSINKDIMRKSKYNKENFKHIYKYFQTYFQKPLNNRREEE